MPDDAYLDIETSFARRITIVGIYRAGRGVLQLVGQQVTVDAITSFLEGAARILTYNGHSFDLPVIRKATGLNLRTHLPCRDLMHDCWRHQLFGGLKKVEKKLGIGRETEGVDGMMAMRLWQKYVDTDDADSLQLLLEYNREDIVNLETLRNRLDEMG